MTDIITRGPKTEYTDEDIERGLQAIAFYGTAYRANKNMPNPIPATTLEQWKTIHAARYHEIRNNTIAEHRARQATLLEDHATEALEVAQLAIAQTRKDLKAGSIRNPHDAAHKLTAAAAQATDKATLLRGMPTQITIHTDANTLLERLERILPASKQPDADTTAQEIQ